MREQTSRNTRWMVALVALALLLALAWGLRALWQAEANARTEPAARAALVVADDSQQTYRIDFASTEPVMVGDANGLLADLAARARMDGGRQIYITGYLEPGIDDVHQTEAALKRARVVKHALEANGVDPRSLILNKPVLPVADSPQTRRVELVLR